MFVDRRGTAEPQGQKLVRGGKEPEITGAPALQSLSCRATVKNNVIFQLHPRTWS